MQRAELLRAPLSAHKCSARRASAQSEHLLISRDFFLKILTSVLNRFHSVPLHRVNCQLLSSEESSRGNLFKAIALHKEWTGKKNLQLFFAV